MNIRKMQSRRLKKAAGRRPLALVTIIKDKLDIFEDIYNQTLQKLEDAEQELARLLLDGNEATTQLRQEIDSLTSEVNLLRLQLAEYDEDVAADLEVETEPTRPVETEPTRPVETEPTEPVIDQRGVTPSGWPMMSSVLFQMVEYNDPTVIQRRFNPDGAIIREGNMRYAVVRKNVNDRLVICIFEQFKGFNATRVTTLIGNVFKNKGAILFNELNIKYDRYELPVGKVKGSEHPGPDAIQVRGALAYREWYGPDANKIRTYQHLNEEIAAVAKVLPNWCKKWAQKGIDKLGSAGNILSLGLYNIGFPKVKGTSSMNGSHGGAALSPFHFGPEGWQQGSDVGYQWAEADMFAALARAPLGVYDRKTLFPVNPHEEYWCGRTNPEKPSNTEAPSGWAPDPDPRCSYLPDLEDHEAHAGSHGARNHSSAGMLAEHDILARILLVEWYWHDYTMWLDGADSQSSLKKSATQVILETEPEAGWSEGGRRIAHGLNCFLMAEKYFAGPARGFIVTQVNSHHPIEVDSIPGKTWRKHLQDVIEHKIRRNGILHCQDHVDANYPWVNNPARTREVQLLQYSLVRLGLIDQSVSASAVLRPTTNGASPPAAFDSAVTHWSKTIDADLSSNNYFPDYDILMGHYARVSTAEPTWQSPSELQIALVPRTYWADKARLLTDMVEEFDDTPF